MNSRAKIVFGFSKVWMHTARIIVLLFGIVPLLAACGITNRGDNTAEVNEYDSTPVTISVAFAMGDSSHLKGIQTIINDYKKSHLNVQITVLENTQKAKGYADDLALLDAMNSFPDLVEMRDTQMFVDAGLLAELPESVSALFGDIPKVNGRVYTAPIDIVMPQGIIYNKKLFRHMGLKEPSTYQEFLDICKTFKSAGITPLIVGGKDLWHMSFWINHFLMDYVYAEDTEWNRKRSAGQVSWIDPGPVRAIQELKALWDNEFVAPGFMNVSDSQTVGYLTTGRAAMLMSGPWMFKQLEQADPNFEIGFFSVPDRKGVFRITGLPLPSGWAISSEAAKDPEKMRVLEQFLQFFFSEEEYPKYLEAAGSLPATKNPMDYQISEPMRDVKKLLDNPRIIKAQSLENFWGEDRIPPGFRNEFFSIVQDCLSGNVSVEEAMKLADQAWEARSEK